MRRSRRCPLPDLPPRRRRGGGSGLLPIGAIILCLAQAPAQAQPRDVREPGLVSYRIEGSGIPLSLTGRPGDPARGRAIAASRTAGHCILCHALPIPEEPAHGNAGPDLAGVADRWSVPEIRLRLVNPKAIDPETMMPAYYRVEGLHRVAANRAGRPLLSAEAIEDLVAYLATLKER